MAGQELRVSEVVHKRMEGHEESPISMGRARLNASPKVFEVGDHGRGLGDLEEMSCL